MGVFYPFPYIVLFSFYTLLISTIEFFVTPSNSLSPPPSFNEPLFSMPPLPRGAARTRGRRAPPAARGRTGRRPCLVPSTNDECDADGGGGDRATPLHRASFLGGGGGTAAAGALWGNGVSGVGGRATDHDNMIDCLVVPRRDRPNHRNHCQRRKCERRRGTGAMTATARFPLLPHNQ